MPERKRSERRRRRPRSATEAEFAAGLGRQKLIFQSGFEELSDAELREVVDLGGVRMMMAKLRRIEDVLDGTEEV